MNQFLKITKKTTPRYVEWKLFKNNLRGSLILKFKRKALVIMQELFLNYNHLIRLIDFIYD